MSSAIVQFKNIAMNAIIHTLKVGEAVRFKAKDIATALEYANTKQAIRVNVDDEDRATLAELMGANNIPLTHNEKQSEFINESGLHALILRSNEPEAKAFKRWVTAEVLPSIRNTGEL